MKRIAVALLLIMTASPLWAEQAVRYTDADGNRHFVRTMKDVPEEYRSTAGIVRLRSKPKQETPPTQPKVAAPTTTEPAQTEQEQIPEFKRSAEDLKSAIRFVKKLALKAAPDGMAIFSGSVKNFLDIPLNNAKVTLEVIRFKGEKSVVIAQPIEGRTGTGIMETNEEADIEIVSTIPVKKVTGFYSRLSWEIVEETTVTTKKTKKK